jgi:hypothetical protein
MRPLAARYAYDGPDEPGLAHARIGAERRNRRNRRNARYVIVTCKVYEICETSLVSTIVGITLRSVGDAWVAVVHSGVCKYCT